MKNNKIIIISVLLGLFFVIGCTKDFEEINTNPNNAISVPSDLLIPDVVRITENVMYSTFVGGDMGSCWAQHMAKINYEEEARYKPRNSVLENTIWKTMFEDVISDAYTMQQLAIEEENDYTQAIGIILQAYAYSVLTEMFGMIPFTEAMQAGAAEAILAPVYDDQLTIYTGIFAMLDEANTLLSTGTGSINTATDILYGGDETGWLKFANSLKFRLLMRISAKGSYGADMQEIVSNRSIFTSNNDEAKLIYLDADPNANPLYESIVFGTRNEYRINEQIVLMLSTLNDPRLAVYAQPLDDGTYVGKPSGIDDVPNDDWNDATVSQLGTFYLDANLPGHFMSYVELQFLMAEAVNKGYITGTQQTHYEKAVKASFDYNGLDAAVATAYLAGDGAYDGTLQQNAEQNWLGLYMQGVEAWTEQRRTGYPVLPLPIEAVEDEIPSRYTYPAIEQSVNPVNYKAAIAAQGSDDLTTKPWWLL